MKYPNFYETIEEAIKRLNNTMVLYDGTPYIVLAIANHKKDGIFRIYLEPCGKGPSKSIKHQIGCPAYQMPWNTPEFGPAMDKFMEDHPDLGVLRKHMNSPLFNKYRPFPLGMVNLSGYALYTERHPLRRMEQGLLDSAIVTYPLTLSGRHNVPSKVSMWTAEFKDTVLGNYPSAQEALSALLDPAVTNDGIAFHRNFAFVRGPLNHVYMAYKSDIVAAIPNGDFSICQLGPDHGHLKESVADLSLFNVIKK